jgi:PAS domain S-box-containing protein
MMAAWEPSAGWKDLFWLVFRRSSNGMFLIDDQRIVVDINDPGLELLGRSRGEIVGGSFSLIGAIRPSERRLAAREWAAYLRSRDYNGTRYMVRADGSELAVDFAVRLATVGDRQLGICVMSARRGESANPHTTRVPHGSLTRREREVVTLIALGNETREIAAELNISPTTVRSHVRSAMAKLDARTRAQLVALALSAGDAIDVAHLK